LLTLLCKGGGFGGSEKHLKKGKGGLLKVKHLIEFIDAQREHGRLALLLTGLDMKGAAAKERRESVIEWALPLALLSSSKILREFHSRGGGHTVAVLCVAKAADVQSVGRDLAFEFPEIPVGVCQTRWCPSFCTKAVERATEGEVEGGARKLLRSVHARMRAPTITLLKKRDLVEKMASALLVHTAEAESVGGAAAREAVVAKLGGWVGKYTLPLVVAFIPSEHWKYPVKRHVFLLADAKASYFKGAFANFTALAVRVWFTRLIHPWCVVHR
jgi:hypothetical protein